MIAPIRAAEHPLHTAAKRTRGSAPMSVRQEKRLIEVVRTAQICRGLELPRSPDAEGRPNGLGTGPVHVGPPIQTDDVHDL